jgi:hypothetical protein
MEKVKQTRKETRRPQRSAPRKMDAEAARKKARPMKAWRWATVGQKIDESCLGSRPGGAMKNACRILRLLFVMHPPARRVPLFFVTINHY